MGGAGSPPGPGSILHLLRTGGGRATIHIGGGRCALEGWTTQKWAGGVVGKTSDQYLGGRGFDPHQVRSALLSVPEQRKGAGFFLFRQRKVKPPSPLVQLPTWLTLLALYIVLPLQ